MVGIVGCNEALFVQVLLLAREMTIIKTGTVVLDGTNIRAKRQPPRIVL